MKEIREFKFSREDLLKMINQEYGKNWTMDQFTMSSRGALIKHNTEPEGVQPWKTTSERKKVQYTLE